LTVSHNTERSLQPTTSAISAGHQGGQLLSRKDKLHIAWVRAHVRVFGLVEVQKMSLFRLRNVSIGRKKKLGADHPDTLTRMANLAVTYQNQGRWDAAEELQVQVMETRKKKLGADHPSTLTSIGNLGFTWKGSGRATEAVKLMGNVYNHGNVYWELIIRILCHLVQL